MHESPLTIPQNRIGKYGISHVLYESGDYFDVIDGRKAEINNMEKETTVMASNGYFHELKKNDLHVMRDFPGEQEEMLCAAEHLSGDVLIGGLGLGLVLYYMKFNKNIRNVIVIEKQKEVIELVWKHLEFLDVQKYRIINQGIDEYIAETKAVFDSCFIDTYDFDNLESYYEIVLPLRIKLRNIVNPKNTFFWNESVMINEIGRIPV